MKPRHCPFNVLRSARKLVDYCTAIELPMSLHASESRPVYQHLGAILADCVLQAGLNYRNVVAPRIKRILEAYPEAMALDGVMLVVTSEETSCFLMWEHHVKINRFNALSRALYERDIVDVNSLRCHMAVGNLRAALFEVDGIGPKTLDYMCCLIGLDEVAVDRHIRSFSKEAGIVENDYGYVKRVFEVAADLLLVSRRELDGVIWRRQANLKSRQTQLGLFDEAI